MLLWLAVTAGAVAAALLVQFVLMTIVLRLVRSHPLVDRILRRLRAPGRVLTAVVVIAISLRYADEMSERARSQIEHGVVLAIIGAVAWFLTRIVGALVDEAISHLPIGGPDNLRARAVQTQLVIVRRVSIVTIVVLGIASALWTFDAVRGLGASILASAGIVGIVAGVSARSTLGNLIAGIQIAFTAPIRIDDVVVVEEQWGRVEEITLTHVVVRTWDHRRLILPCLRFVEEPFENWTRPTSDLLASATLELDPSVDVDDIRAAVDEFLVDQPLWDKRENVVQVVESGPRSVTVRVLLSARNSSNAWDLRCAAREHVLRHLRKHQPHALPQLRVATVDEA